MKFDPFIVFANLDIRDVEHSCREERGPFVMTLTPHLILAFLCNRQSAIGGRDHV